ncbi:neurotensin/neuromedin N isoform X2 [Protopterus annectens]|uniref:neurotensin/neuromedin N isoform X2 n=1 Tax=Protopterus annectens TaxID=7888 RepID=UPI001CFBE289|nr:neurotensin/neuromedin N isoform X2 [Protopterus annectens]
MSFDSEESMNTLETDLLNDLYSSKVNKPGLTYWKLTLPYICSLLSNANNQAEDSWRNIDEEISSRSQLSAPQNDVDLEAVLMIYQLQNLCSSTPFQQWQPLHQELTDQGVSNIKKEGQLKRKAPYILKRQLHVSKPRRPYILKRNSVF